MNSQISIDTFDKLNELSRKKFICNGIEYSSKIHIDENKYNTFLNLLYDEPSVLAYISLNNYLIGFRGSHSCLNDKKLNVDFFHFLSSIPLEKKRIFVKIILFNKKYRLLNLLYRYIHDIIIYINVSDILFLALSTGSYRKTEIILKNLHLLNDLYLLNNKFIINFFDVIIRKYYYKILEYFLLKINILKKILLDNTHTQILLKILKFISNPNHAINNFRIHNVFDGKHYGWYSQKMYFEYTHRNFVAIYSLKLFDLIIEIMLNYKILKLEYIFKYIQITVFGNLSNESLKKHVIRIEYRGPRYVYDIDRILANIHTYHITAFENILQNITMLKIYLIFTKKMNDRFLIHKIIFFLTNNNEFLLYYLKINNI